MPDTPVNILRKGEGVPSWGRAIPLFDGYEIDALTEGGLYAVTNPKVGGAVESGSFLVWVYTGNVGGRSFVHQRMFSLTGSEIYRNNGVTGAVRSFRPSGQKPFIEVDFLGSEHHPFIFTGANVGSAQSVVTGSILNSRHPGIQQLSSFTGSNRSGVAYTTAVPTLINGGERLEAVCRTPASFTNVTWDIGFMNSYSSAPTRYVAFEIQIGNSVIEVKGRTGNVDPQISAASMCTLAVNTWYRFRVDVAVDRSSATFTVFSEDGVVLGTDTLDGGIPANTDADRGQWGPFLRSNADLTGIVGYVDYISLDYPNGLAR